MQRTARGGVAPSAQNVWARLLSAHGGGGSALSSMSGSDDDDDDERSSDGGDYRCQSPSWAAPRPRRAPRVEPPAKRMWNAIRAHASGSDGGASSDGTGGAPQRYVELTPLTGTGTANGTASSCLFGAPLRDGHATEAPTTTKASAKEWRMLRAQTGQ